jgi:hypothetical protein
LTVTDVAPVFVKVTTPVLFAIPLGSVMVKGSGVIEIPEDVPVPLRVTGEPATGPSAVMAKDPGAEPSATGRNLTMIVHVDPLFRVLPQVPPDLKY